MLNAKIKMKSICKFYCSKSKKSKGEMFEMTVARTVEAVERERERERVTLLTNRSVVLTCKLNASNRLNTIDIDGSRDRRSLLFCGMQSK